MATICHNHYLAVLKFQPVIFTVVMPTHSKRYAISDLDQADTRQHIARLMYLF